MKKDNIDLKNSVTFLSNIFGQKIPLAKLFKTESNSYVYDSATNKILSCDLSTFSLLEMLFSKRFEAAIHDFIEENGEDYFVKTASTLKRSIERHNLFRLYEVTNFNLFPNKKELQEAIQNMSNMLGLEVTEQCNLRCLYCVHIDENKEARAHGNKNMSVETAFAAIDYLKKNSKKADAISIIFYGGEPLLNLSLIKQSIEYAKKIFSDRKISFSMTTNCTLITPETSRYLFANNVSVKVSIDGPEEVHNRYRKNPAGKGSYQDVIGGLKHLYEAYKDDFTKKISLNIVYAPPFSVEQIEKRAGLWDELDWLPNDILAGISYYSGPRLPNICHKEDKDLLQWAFDEYINNMKKNIKPHPFARHMIEKPLAVLSQRTIYNDGTNEFALNGCCIPGVRRVFVTALGDLRLCERIPISAPVIGNVKEGADLDTIYKVYIKDYSDMSLQICRNCWAVNICDSCFVDGYDDNGMSSEKKSEACKRIRLSTAKQIYNFLKVLEFAPEMLGYLNSIKLK